MPTTLPTVPVTHRGGNNQLCIAMFMPTGTGKRPARFLVWERFGSVTLCLQREYRTNRTECCSLGCTHRDAFFNMKPPNVRVFNRILAPLAQSTSRHSSMPQFHATVPCP